MTSAIALTLCAAWGCSRRVPDARAQWLHERGRQALDWGACARLGAVLRSSCDGDAACESKVSFELSYHCYAGVFAAGFDVDDLPPEKLSPCLFAERHGGPGPARTDADALANHTALAAAWCEGQDLPGRYARHCRAEVLTAFHELCWMGDPALTGAGP